MTHLRRIILEELQRRHYSQATTQRYIRLVERFAQHFHSSPDRLGRQHIREYQAQLFTVQKHPIGNRNRSNVASLADQINNGPVLFALLEMLQCQSHGFMPSQPTRE